jgi:hypothetical protein
VGVDVIKARYKTLFTTATAWNRSLELDRSSKLIKKEILH